MRLSSLTFHFLFSILNSLYNTKAQNTIVFVTHDVDEAVYLADKIVIMDKNPGKIAKILEVDIERPRKRESAEFIDLQESIVENLDMGE